MIEYIQDYTEPLVEGMIKIDPIKFRYEMPSEIETAIRATPYDFKYGAFSFVVFYRTYSRLKEDGSKESYPDTIVRVIKGLVSIIKDWKIKYGLGWDSKYWDNIALRMGVSMMKMHFLPPGRGLWVLGSEFCYNRGSSALNNCGFVSSSVGLKKALTWTIDSLACGCGIGFSTDASDEELSKLVIPGCNLCRSNFDSCCSCNKRVYKIHDSRQGWTKSIDLLVDSYFTGTLTKFDYSSIRPYGAPINGFGGTSSGSEPLEILHKRLCIFFECYIKVNIGIKNNLGDFIKVFPYDAIVSMTEKHRDIYSIDNKVERPSLDWALSELKNMTYEMQSKKTYGKSRFIVDCFNAVAICIVAGNVRRSSEIALATADDVEFRHLKDHNLNPERGIISWMSNNTVCLDKTEDFLHLPEIAKRIRDNGEPGIYNRLNVTRYGRYGKREPIGREGEEDKAIGINPCITGDSMVSTSEGLVSVRELVGKQFIATYDYGNYNESFKSTSVGFWSNGIKPVYELKLKNGSSIKATEDHKIGVVTKHGEYKWVKMKDLDINNAIIDTDSNTYSMIESIEYIGEEEVFDCSIPGPNSFYANGISVHNCGEIPLESFEFCNLAEIFPSKCDTFEEMEEAAFLATIYTSTVSLLPTHWIETNKVIARNRRTGIALGGITEEIARSSMTEFTKRCRALYRLIRKTNKEYADENGVVESIRVTTIKPSGTISQLASVTSGIHHPVYPYAIRRVRMGADSRLVEMLKKSGYKYEIDKKAGEGTIIFSFPLCQTGARPAQEVSVWEQASNLAMMSREYADNAVSCTLYFNEKIEGLDLEHLLAHVAPVVKSLSCLPHSDDTVVYEQAPYEKISEEEYYRMLTDFKELDFSDLSEKVDNDIIVTREEDAVGEKGCTNDTCDFKAYMETKKKRSFEEDLPVEACETIKKSKK